MFGYKGFQVYMYMETLKLTCANCNLEFNRSKVGLREQPRYFCSLSCSVKTKNKEQIAKRQAEYDKNPKRCKHCNTPIAYASRHRGVFCNHSCSATYNNPKRAIPKIPKEPKIRLPKAPKVILPKAPKESKLCIFCGSKFFIKVKERANKYCSLTCVGKAKKTEINQQVRNGTYKHSNGTHTASNKVYKRVLIEDRGHKCEVCNISEWGGKPILLILDHIDGYSSNYKLENLRLICSNCDTLNPTYKGRNKGKGNEQRRLRYKKVSEFKDQRTK